MSSLVVVDHPILDLVMPIEAEELSKLGLEPDSCIWARPKDAELYAQLELDDATSRVPGGCGLNSLRAAAWWLRVHGKTLASLGFLGAVGYDANADVLRESIKKVGITASMQVCNGVPTGKSAILVEGKTRTMVTDLGAARQMSLETAREFEETFTPLLGPEGNLVLTTGYFIAQDPVGARRLMRESHGRYVLALTLAATFTAVKPIVVDFLRSCQIVFGTLAEAVAFSKANGGPEDGDGVATLMQQWPGCEDRWVVITDGPNSVCFAHSDGLCRLPVPRIESGLIVDDNGAGDAFAGAFLACYSCGGSPQECLAAGMLGAREALQNIGCNFRDPTDVSETQSGPPLCSFL